MLIYLYLFAFGLGGVLLLGSIFLGDKDTDAGGGEGGDADAGGTEAQHFDNGVGEAHGSVAGLFTAFLSLRFWMFFLAFFGLTGLVLDGLDLVDSSTVALVAAVVMGLATGQGTVLVFRHLARSETGRAPTVADYIGRSGRVLVGFAAGDLGKVRLTLGGTTVDVLATTEEERAFSPGDDALVIAMHDTTAVVARIAPSSSSSGG